MVSEEIKPASYAHHLEEVNEEETSPSVVATKYMNKVSRKRLFFCRRKLCYVNHHLGSPTVFRKASTGNLTSNPQSGWTHLVRFPNMLLEESWGNLVRQ